MPRFAELLRHYIESANWTQDDFAEEINGRVQKRRGEGEITGSLVRYWLEGNLPNARQFEAIESLLFGPPPEDPNRQKRYEFRQCYEGFPWWQHVLNAKENATARSFDRIAGLWEVYYYSFAQEADGQTGPLLSLQLLDIHRVNPLQKNLIDCSCTDFDENHKELRFDGHIVQVNETLYTFLEDSSSGNEIIVHVVDLPTGQRDILYGIVAGVPNYDSRGGRRHTPTTARLALRRLGRLSPRLATAKKDWWDVCDRCVMNMMEEFDAQEWKSLDSAIALRESLKVKIGGYIDLGQLGSKKFNKNEDIRKELEAIATRISNEVSSAHVPFVLQGYR